MTPREQAAILRELSVALRDGEKRVTHPNPSLADALEAGAQALDAGGWQHERNDEEKDHGAGLIHQTIPDVAETEPRLIKMAGTVEDDANGSFIRVKWCEARSQRTAAEPSYSCCLPEYHHGPHEAHGDRYYLSWPKETDGNQAASSPAVSAVGAKRQDQTLTP